MDNWFDDITAPWVRLGQWTLALAHQLVARQRKPVGATDPSTPEATGCDRLTRLSGLSADTSANRRPAGYRVSLVPWTDTRRHERWRRPHPTKAPGPERAQSQATQHMIRVLQRLCIDGANRPATADQGELAPVPHGPSTMVLAAGHTAPNLALPSSEQCSAGPHGEQALMAMGLSWRPCGKDAATPARPLELITQYRHQLAHTKLAYGQAMLDLHTRNKLTALMNETRD